MGRCKETGECFMCGDIILTYDEYEYREFEGDGVIICCGVDPDRSGGVFYETDCIRDFEQMVEIIDSHE